MGGEVYAVCSREKLRWMRLWHLLLLPVRKLQAEVPGVRAEGLVVLVWGEVQLRLQWERWRLWESAERRAARQTNEAKTVVHKHSGELVLEKLMIQVQE